MPIVYGYGADRLIMAATVAKANEVIKRIATTAIQEHTAVGNSWRGPEGNVDLVYTSPEKTQRGHGRAFSRGPAYTVSLELARNSYESTTSIGFILRCFPYQRSASFCLNYALAETFAEEWSSHTEGPWYHSGELVTRPVEDGVSVHADIQGPIQLIEGVMARDFMVACADPDAILRRAPDVSYYVPVAPAA